MDEEDPEAPGDEVTGPTTSEVVLGWDELFWIPYVALILILMILALVSFCLYHRRNRDRYQNAVFKIKNNVHSVPKKYRVTLNRDGHVGCFISATTSQSSNRVDSPVIGNSIPRSPRVTISDSEPRKPSVNFDPESNVNHPLESEFGSRNSQETSPLSSSAERQRRNANSSGPEASRKDSDIEDVLQKETETIIRIKVENHVSRTPTSPRQQTTPNSPHTDRSQTDSKTTTTSTTATNSNKNTTNTSTTKRKATDVFSTFMRISNKHSLSKTSKVKRQTDTSKVRSHKQTVNDFTFENRTFDADSSIESDSSFRKQNSTSSERIPECIDDVHDETAIVQDNNNIVHAQVHKADDANDHSVPMTLSPGVSDSHNAPKPNSSNSKSREARNKKRKHRREALSCRMAHINSSIEERMRSNLAMAAEIEEVIEAV